MLSLGLLGLSLSTAAYSWSYCALEDDVCKVNGQAVVRYGANGQYAYRQVTGPVLCSNQNFGDPAPKQPKECAVNYHPNALREAAGQRGGVPYPDTPGYPSGNATAPIAGGGEWRTCAMEDEFAPSVDRQKSVLVQKGAITFAPLLMVWRAMSANLAIPKMG
jgi:hypothetical protein